MKTIINKIQKLKTQLHEVEGELVLEFKKALQKVFKDHNDLENVHMSVNNHEFNDGGATAFYLCYEDLTVTVNGEEITRTWNNTTKSYVKNPILDTLIELFEDTQSIHERVFGGEYESMTLDRDTVLDNDFLKD